MKLIDLHTTFNVCSCADRDSINKTLKYLFEYLAMPIKERTFTAFINLGDISEGTYYLLTGILEKENLIDHGSSIRFAWLTDKGKEILKELQ